MSRASKAAKLTSRQQEAVNSTIGSVIAAEQVNDALRTLTSPQIAVSGTTQIIDQAVRYIDQFLEIDDISFFNKYHLNREITRIDPKVDAALVQIGNVVEKSYDRPMIKTKYKTNVDHVLAKQFLEDVDDILAQIDFDQLLGEFAYNLNRDGDLIHKIIWNGNDKKAEIEQIIPIPLQITTIVDKDYSPGKIAANVGDLKDNPTSRYIIKNRDLYYTNESLGYANYDKYVGTYNDKILPENIWHISLLSYGNWTEDILRRLTYNVWGVSPLESLRLPVKIRYILQRIDLRTTYLNIPKKHHKINLESLLDLTQYTGTMEERMDKAWTLIKKNMDLYKQGLTVTDSSGVKGLMEPETGFITTNNVEINTIGGNSVYKDLIPVIRDIDQSISSRLGIPLNMLGYEAGSTQAIGYITRTYMGTYGVGLLNAIEAAVKDLVWRSFEKQGKLSKYPKKFFNYFYLRYIVDDFEAERSKIYTEIALYKAGLKTFGQTLEALGLNLTGKPELDDRYYVEDKGGTTNVGDPNDQNDNQDQQLNDPESDINKIIKQTQKVQRQG